MNLRLIPRKTVAAAAHDLHQAETPSPRCVCISLSPSGANPKRASRSDRWCDSPFLQAQRDEIILGHRVRRKPPICMRLKRGSPDEVPRRRRHPRRPCGITMSERKTAARRHTSVAARSMDRIRIDEMRGVLHHADGFVLHQAWSHARGNPAWDEVGIQGGDELRLMRQSRHVASSA